MTEKRIACVHHRILITYYHPTDKDKCSVREHCNKGYDLNCTVCKDFEPVLKK